MACATPWTHAFADGNPTLTQKQKRPRSARRGLFQFCFAKLAAAFHDHANDLLHNQARNTAADKVSKHRADVHASACVAASSAHQPTKQLTTTDTAYRTSDEVADVAHAVFAGSDFATAEATKCPADQL
jgi:hypothetical protein